MVINEENQIENIKNFAFRVRKNILEMAVSAGAGSAHFGGALSITEIVSKLILSADFPKEKLELIILPLTIGG